MSEALESLLLACLSKRPEGRPTTAGELGKRLSDLPARHELGPDALSEWWQRTRRLEASPTPDREPSVASASTVLNIELDARA